jgi:hypothetical protein
VACLDARAGNGFAPAGTVRHRPVPFDHLEAVGACARARAGHPMLEDPDVGVKGTADTLGRLLHGPVDRVGDGAGAGHLAGSGSFESVLDTEADRRGERLDGAQSAGEVGIAVGEVRGHGWSILLRGRRSGDQP